MYHDWVTWQLLWLLRCTAAIHTIDTGCTCHSGSSKYIFSDYFLLTKRDESNSISLRALRFIAIARAFFVRDRRSRVSYPLRLFVFTTVHFRPIALIFKLNERVLRTRCACKSGGFKRPRRNLDVHDWRYPASFARLSKVNFRPASLSLSLSLHRFVIYLINVISSIFLRGFLSATDISPLLIIYSAVCRGGVSVYRNITSAFNTLSMLC